MLCLVLHDGSAGLYPRAIIRNPNGTTFASVDIDGDNGDGSYQQPFTVIAGTTEEDRSVTYRAFTDALRTIPSDFDMGHELLQVRKGVLDKTVNDHMVDESVGEAIVHAGAVHTRSTYDAYQSFSGTKRITDGTTTYHRTEADAAAGASPLSTKEMDSTHVDVQQWNTQVLRRTS